MATPRVRVERQGGKVQSAFSGVGVVTFDAMFFDELPDGRLKGLWVFDSPAEFAPDGRRIDFPLTGEWWARANETGGDR